MAAECGSICLLRPVAISAVVPIFMGCREGTAPSPAVSGVTAPGNKEKLGQKGNFTGVDVAEGVGDAPCLHGHIRLAEDTWIFVIRCHIKGNSSAGHRVVVLAPGSPWGCPLLRGVPKGGTKQKCKEPHREPQEKLCSATGAPRSGDSLALPPSRFPHRHKSGLEGGAIPPAGPQVMAFH